MHAAAFKKQLQRPGIFVTAVSGKRPIIVVTLGFMNFRGSLGQFAPRILAAPSKALLGILDSGYSRRHGDYWITWRHAFLFLIGWWRGGEGSALPGRVGYWWERWWLVVYNLKLETMLLLLLWNRGIAE